MSKESFIDAAWSAINDALSEWKQAGEDRTLGDLEKIMKTAKLLDGIKLPSVLPVPGTSTGPMPQVTLEDVLERLEAGNA